MCLSVTDVPVYENGYNMTISVVHTDNPILESNVAYFDHNCQNTVCIDSGSLRYDTLLDNFERREQKCQLARSTELFVFGGCERAPRIILDNM